MDEAASAPAEPEDIAEDVEDLEEEARRSIFASHVAHGSPLPDALYAAGYASKNIHLGWQLMSVPSVREQVDRHRSWIREKQARTVAELVDQLDRDREFAYETRQAAVAVAATMAQAKLLGAMDPGGALKNGQKRLVIVWGGDETADISPDRLIELQPVGEEAQTRIEEAAEALSVAVERTGTDDP